MPFGIHAVSFDAHQFLRVSSACGDEYRKSERSRDNVEEPVRALPLRIEIERNGEPLVGMLGS